MNVLDLTQPLDERTVLRPAAERFEAVGPEEYDEDGFWSRRFSSPEHTGTHLDAPTAWRTARRVGDIAAERLLRPAVRIDALRLPGASGTPVRAFALVP